MMNTHLEVNEVFLEGCPTFSEASDDKDHGHSEVCKRMLNYASE